MNDSHSMRSINYAREAGKQTFEDVQQSLIEKMQNLDLELRAVSIGLKNKIEETERLHEQMTKIFECLPLGAILCNQDSKILQINSPARDFLGAGPLLKRGQALDPEWRRCQLPPPPFSRHVYQGKLLNCWEEVIGEPGVFPCLTVRFMVNEQEGSLALDESSLQGPPNLEEILAKVAHDIRNSLSSIGLFASLVERRVCNESEHQRLGIHLQKSVKSLEQFVTKMVVPNSKNITLEMVNVPALFDQVEILLSEPLQAHRVTLRRTIEHDAEFLKGDAVLLQRACLNVLHNALAVSLQGGVIEVEARRIQAPQTLKDTRINGICIQVHDYGYGIKAEDLQHVYEPRFSRRSGGSGLGLSIVKEIMDAHQGTIDIQSQEGEGTTVSLSFPQQRRSV